MPLWRILVYVAEDTVPPPFLAWYNGQDVTVRAKVHAALVSLSGVESWDEEDVEEFKPLTENDAGLGEVIVEVIQQAGKKQVKRQIRCLGIWPPDGKEFVLLNGLEKSGRSPNPSNAYSEAHRLRRAYGQGRGAVDDYFK